MTWFCNAGVVVLAVPKTDPGTLEKTLGRRADLYLERHGQGKHMTCRAVMATPEPQIRDRGKRPARMFRHDDHARLGRALSRQLGAAQDRTGTA